MRFKDEKPMWHADTELLAEKVANKTVREVQKIFDSHDVIKLRSCERPEVTVTGRLLFPIIFIALIPVVVLKWVATGDMYLDAIVKRFKWLGAIIDYCGIK